MYSSRNDDKIYSLNEMSCPFAFGLMNPLNGVYADLDPSIGNISIQVVNWSF